MSIRYHGNWCGPGWSDGKYQSSVRGYAPPIDELDVTCQDHDGAYFDGADANIADRTFYEANVGGGFKRSFAAFLVKGQSLVRPSANNKSNLVDMPRVRGAQVRPMPTTMIPKRPSKPKTVASRPARQPSQAALRVTKAPVSIGTTVVAQRPLQTRTPRGCRLVGREFMASVFESNNSNWQLAALCPLHPAYFVSSTIGNVARGFTKYRWNKLVVHFVTRQPTSVTGEIALAYSSNCFLPAENGASGAFLPRVMSRGNAVLGPLWTGHSIVIPTDKTYRLVDPLSSISYNENVLGEVQAYTLSSVSDTAGYFLFDYDIEFIDVMYQPHSISIPVSLGTGASYTLVDTSTTPTASNAVQCSNAALSGFPTGAVYRLVLDLDQSTLAGGTNAGNAWEVNTAYSSSLTAITSVASNLTMADGMQIYATVVNTSLYLYTSYEAAVNGDSTGQLFYRTTGNAAGSYVCIGYLVRSAPAILAVTQ